MPVFTSIIATLVEVGFSTYFASAIVTPTLGVAFSEFVANDIKSKDKK
jgi:hypothetical protein